MGLPCGQLKERPLAIPTKTIIGNGRWTLPDGSVSVRSAPGIASARRDSVEMQREAEDTERDPMGDGEAGGGQGGQ